MLSWTYVPKLKNMITDVKSVKKWSDEIPKAQFKHTKPNPSASIKYMRDRRFNQ